MKNILFIVSHLGSGSNFLFDALNKNPRIQGIRTNTPYSHPDSLDVLTSTSHKTDNSAAIYMDELLYNFVFSCPQLYRECKFIYFVREARPTLNKIVSIPSLNQKYEPEYASKYYRYRLRRMCEMAKRTPDAPFLTFDDLISKKKNLLIEQYLNLKDPIEVPEIKDDYSDAVDIDVIKNAQESYDRYFYYFKKFLINKI